MKNELISIIVPIYNAEKYLEKCVRSIQNQTYENIEIILVDDGSGDNSFKVCEKLASQDERIKIFTKANSGVADTRNYGIERASGDYLAFIDADDFIHPDMYQCLYNNMMKYNAEIAVCDYIECGDDIPYHECNGNNEDGILYSREDAMNTYFTDERVTFVLPPNKLYKRRVFEEYKFVINKPHEDECTVFKLLYIANGIVYVKEPFYNYYRHDSSIIGTTSGLKRLGIFEAYKEKINYFLECGEYDVCVKYMEIFMHMSAKCVEWLKEDKCYKRKYFNDHQQFIKKLYSNLKGKCRISRKNKIEYTIYVNSMTIYYNIWKNGSKIQKNN